MSDESGDTDDETVDADGCPLCAKHRGEGPHVGPVVYRDAYVHVAHRATGPLGYLFIDSARHAAQVGDLTDDEVAAVGRIRSWLARALRAELDLVAVHSAVAGLGVPHFHEHVFVRPVGIPTDEPWWPMWSAAPTGDIEEFCRRLAGHLADPVRG